MNTNQKGAWIQTYTGKAFIFSEPEKHEYCIEDIAHALSQLCRFNGHTLKFYSVAQHSVIVSRLVESSVGVGDLRVIQAILHDATEAYVGDMVSPLKRSMAAYRDLEDRVWVGIAKRFGVPQLMAPAVKEADLIALATEKRDLMGQEPRGWDLGCLPSDVAIKPISAKKAEKLFLNRYHELMSAYGK
jgi:5'-deoxynucleotidase YfbR-like HD superfamily hydrolase